MVGPGSASSVNGRSPGPLPGSPGSVLRFADRTFASDHGQWRPARRCRPEQSLRGSGPARGAVTGSVALLLSCCGPGGLLGTIQWARALPSLKMKWPITQTFFP